ncbi:enterochelin esterase [Serratia sp. MYb239]|uniref:enterochelin esterase n=1 Tax=Serratia sp. MYb239 TaxID=2033438 RepID=UPI000CF6ECE5|nr:enterochelin esterase [Serratia sp. MYb239]AVJ17491.1 enterochelin esterase [Serratia sp. MYb239]
MHILPAARQGAAVSAQSTVAAGTVSRWLQAEQAGQAAWWQQVVQRGTPIVEEHDRQQARFTWLWRDPHGDEPRSPIRRVYVDINGVTDHHSTDPSTLQRLPGTDIWHWSTLLPRDWRGSYSLIPVQDAQLPPVFSADRAQCRQQQRAWWISLFPLAIADPLNPYPAASTRIGQPLSLAQGPDAADQRAWLTTPPPLDVSRLHHFLWRSETLGNQRRIWAYASGEGASAAERPLVILLDGQNWVDGQPLLPVLARETAAGRLPPACYLLIDVIDGQHRERELPCNADFWLALQAELLPLVRQRMAFSDSGARTVVAGQSYGGLAAMYAGLHWPQRFGRVLSQSGSFWWPTVQYVTDFARRAEFDEGWLTQQVRQGRVAAGTLTVFQEAGDREADIEFVNQQMQQALKAAGHRVNYRVFSGGHDALCWRGGLLDGLHWLLSDMDDIHFD